MTWADCEAELLLLTERGDRPETLPAKHDEKRSARRAEQRRYREAHREQVREARRRWYAQRKAARYG